MRPVVFTTLVISLALGTPTLLGLADEMSYRPYRVEHKSASTIGRVLGEALPELADSPDMIVDERHQRLLIRGTSDVHELVAELLRAADIPAPKAAPRTKSSQNASQHTTPPVTARRELRVYEGPPAELNDVARQLRQHYGDQMRVASIPEEGRLIISAPVLLHQAVQQRLPELRQLAGTSTEEPLAREATRPSQSLRPSDPTPRGLSSVNDRDFGASLENAPSAGGGRGSSNSASPDVSERHEGGHRPVGPRRLEPTFVAIRPDRLRASETRLRQSLGDRMTEVHDEEDENSPVVEYLVHTASGQTIDFAVDYERSGFWFRGPEPLVEQLKRLSKTLDHPTSVDGRLIRVLPVEQSDPAKLRTAIEAYRRPHARPSVTPLRGPFHAPFSASSFSRRFERRGSERGSLGPRVG
jgi:hypothetical protein